MVKRQKYLWTLRDAYKSYKRDTKKDIPNRISLPKFTVLFNTFLLEMVKGIIKSATLWSMPYNMGSMYIQKSYKPRYIDWGKTRKVGKRIYSYNDHTGGFVYEMVYTGPKRWNNKKYYNMENIETLTKKVGKSVMEYVDKGEYMPAYNIIDERTRKESYLPKIR